MSLWEHPVCPLASLANLEVTEGERSMIINQESPLCQSLSSRFAVIIITRETTGRVQPACCHPAPKSGQRRKQKDGGQAGPQAVKRATPFSPKGKECSSKEVGAVKGHSLKPERTAASHDRQHSPRLTNVPT